MGHSVEKGVGSPTIPLCAMLYAILPFHEHALSIKLPNIEKKAILFASPGGRHHRLPQADTAIIGGNLLMAVYIETIFCKRPAQSG